ncbi:unnamed protein product [Boreogadus saida]
MAEQGFTDTQEEKLMIPGAPDVFETLITNANNTSISRIPTVAPPPSPPESSSNELTLRALWNNSSSLQSFSEADRHQREMRV